MEGEEKRRVGKGRGRRALLLRKGEWGGKRRKRGGNGRGPQGLVDTPYVSNTATGNSRSGSQNPPPLSVKIPVKEIPPIGLHPVCKLKIIYCFYCVVLHRAQYCHGKQGGWKYDKSSVRDAGVIVIIKFQSAVSSKSITHIVRLGSLLLVDPNIIDLVQG